MKNVTMLQSNSEKKVYDLSTDEGRISFKQAWVKLQKEEDYPSSEHLWCQVIYNVLPTVTKRLSNSESYLLWDKGNEGKDPGSVYLTKQQEQCDND